MAKKVIVEGDPVRGQDTHGVVGMALNTTPPPPPPPPQLPYSGFGKFDYVGSMSVALSGLMFIDDIPVALTSSSSMLDAGQNVPPGKHSGPNSSAPTKPEPTPPAARPITGLTITDDIGPGKPSATAGSALVTVDGDAVLLDGDSIDTCDALDAVGNSTVAAEGQTLVEVAE